MVQHRRQPAWLGLAWKSRPSLLSYLRQLGDITLLVTLLLVTVCWD